MPNITLKNEKAPIFGENVAQLKGDIHFKWTFRSGNLKWEVNKMIQHPLCQLTINKILNVLIYLARLFQPIVTTSLRRRNGKTLQFLYCANWGSLQQKQVSPCFRATAVRGKTFLLLVPTAALSTATELPVV